MNINRSEEEKCFALAYEISNYLLSCHERSATFLDLLYNDEKDIENNVTNATKDLLTNAQYIMEGYLGLTK